VSKDPEVLFCKLVRNKVTLVHQALWAPLAALADRFPVEALDRVIQEHTSSGIHRNRVEAFPDWLPEKVGRKAAKLPTDSAAVLVRKWPAGNALLEGIA